MKKFFVKTILFIFLFLCPSYAGDYGAMIEDFTHEPQKRWQFFTDQVMGGVSEGGARIVSDPKGSYVRMEGSVSTANNGGFIQLRTYLNGGPKNAKGILLKVRGNGENYYIHMKTSETNSYREYYRAIFSTSNNWVEVKLPFSEAFKRSSSWISNNISAEKIRAIGLVAYGKDHNALLEVSYLSFY